MAGHVRALAILQIAYASMGLVGGVLLLLIFGGTAAIVGVSASLDDSLVALPVLAVIGGLTSSILVLLSLPRLLAGIGLLRHRHWGRVLTLVVSILGLLDLPFGTALGLYGLWVLTHRETGPLFGELPVAATPR